MQNFNSPGYKRLICCLWNEKILTFSIEKNHSQQTEKEIGFTAENFVSFKLLHQPMDFLFWSDIIFVYSVNLSELSSKGFLTGESCEKFENSNFFFHSLLPFKLPMMIGSMTRLDCESRIFHGHPFHPLHKSRIFPLGNQISSQEIIQNSPELGVEIELPFVEVPFMETFGSWKECLMELGIWKEGTFLIPVHPLQKLPKESNLKKNLRPFPLCNWRTFSLEKAASLDVKLALFMQTTSSNRTLSRFATYNGPILSEYFWGKVEKRISMLLPSGNSFKFCLEVAGAFFESGISCLFRRIPPTEFPNCHYIPVAFLFEPMEDDGKIFALSHYIHKPEAIRTLISCLVRGLLVTWLEFGVSLEVHGQNVMFLWDSGEEIIRGIAYRDFGGLKVLPEVAQELCLLPNSPIIARNGQEEMFCTLSHGLFSLLIPLHKCTCKNWPIFDWAKEEIISTLGEFPCSAKSEFLFRSLLREDEVPMKSLLVRACCEKNFDGDEILWCKVPNPLLLRKAK